MQIRPPQPDARCAPFGASLAPAGAVVFHRYLQQLNAEQRIDPAAPIRHARPPIVDTAEFASCPAPADAPAVDTGLAKLGDVPPASVPATVTPETRVVFQQRTPITGRLIDLMA